jgi:hypothetical protein
MLLAREGQAGSALRPEIGTDMDNATLRRLAQGEIADLTWEAPADLVKHGQICQAGIQDYQSEKPEEGEQLWQQAQDIWSRA